MIVGGCLGNFGGGAGFGGIFSNLSNLLAFTPNSPSFKNALELSGTCGWSPS